MKAAVAHPRNRRHPLAPSTATVAKLVIAQVPPVPASSLAIGMTDRRSPTFRPDRHARLTYLALTAEVFVEAAVIHRRALEAERFACKLGHGRLIIIRRRHCGVIRTS